MVMDQYKFPEKRLVLVDYMLRNSFLMSDWFLTFREVRIKSKQVFIF